VLAAATWLPGSVDDKQILQHIDALVTEEHQLRTSRAHGGIDIDTEADRLRQLEETLDQCWDLLRRRRALKEAGQEPAAAAPAPVSQVEGYLQ
jgi:hypothetical protein